jgi:DNA-binding NtrC family response regulator
MQSAARKFERAELIGTSREIEKIRNIIEGISDKNVNIVISGERGVEKELLARVIHNESKRASVPFSKFTIKDESVETLRSKLFGSGRGSFAATLEREKGAFEQACSGTLYLANIENLPISLQKEIALALRKKEITREGSSVPIPIDVRIICGANSNLKELVAEGHFEKALYEALSEISIEIPPLRERSSDIPLFIDHFIEKYNKLYGKEINGFTKDALEAISGFSFPGNVEELKHVIENIILTFDGVNISCEKLPLHLLANSKTFTGTDESRNLSLENSYEKLEKKYIAHVLDTTGSNHTKTAELLGLQRAVLSAKLESLKIKK